MAVYEYDSQNQELKRIAGGTLYADMPIGSEIEYAGTTAPTGFLKCDGSTYSQITYPELYAILGTTTLPNKSGYIIKAKQIGVPADFANAIEDVIEEKFSYSTSEVNTGKKWIDGKPIYRKTLVFTNLTLSSASAQIGTIDIAINNITKTEEIVRRNDVIAGSSQQAVYVAGNGDIYASQTVSSTNTGWEIYYTVEYTKTTD